MQVYKLITTLFYTMLNYTIRIISEIIITYDNEPVGGIN